MAYNDSRENEYTISHMDENLKGVAVVGSRLCHVEGALVGETVLAEDKYRKDSNIYAKAISILKNPNPLRVKSPCRYYDQCGNCHLLHMDYKAGLELKRALVARELSECLKGKEVSQAAGVFYPFKTRNKLQLAFSNEGGRLKIGFFSEFSKKIFNIESCLMHDSWSDKIITIARNYMEKFKLLPYNEMSENGSIRYLVARCFEDNILVTIVSAKDKTLGLKWLYTELTKHFKKVSLYLNINQSKQSNVFGDKFTHVDGAKGVTGLLLGVRFELTPKTFFQTNTKIAGQIYTEVAEVIARMGVSEVIDAYSGIGVTSLLLAKQGLNVASVEIEMQAVAEARRLAKINNLPLRAECGDASRILPALLADYPNSVVFLDPPRDGLGGAITPILTALPKNIIYISCNLNALKGDLAKFVQKGYKIISVKPYDMFCQTRYVETLVVLQK